MSTVGAVEPVRVLYLLWGMVCALIVVDEARKREEDNGDHFWRQLRQNIDAKQ